MYKPKTRKSRLVAVAIVLAALAAVAAGLYFDSYNETTRVRRGRQERIRLAREDSAALKVAVMPTLDCLPLYVAREHHLLDSLCADIRLKRFRALMDCDTALVGGSVELAMTDLVRTEWMQAEGIPIDYLSATDAHWQLLTARHARIAQLKQLFDKMLATPRHSATDLLATYAVDSAALQDERVFRIQVNDVGLRLAMMLNGEMEAALLPEPQATAARQAKARVLLDTRKLGFRLGVLAMRKATASDSSRARQIAVLRRAYDQAVDSINKHGALRYAPLLVRECGVGEKAAAALPASTRFAHVSAPRQADVERARKWVARIREEERKTRQP